MRELINEYPNLFSLSLMFITFALLAALYLIFVRDPKAVRVARAKKNEAMWQSVGQAFNKTIKHAAGQLHEKLTTMTPEERKEFNAMTARFMEAKNPHLSYIISGKKPGEKTEEKKDKPPSLWT